MHLRHPVILYLPVRLCCVIAFVAATLGGHGNIFAETLRIQSVRVVGYRIERTKVFVTSKGTSDSVYGLFIIIEGQTGGGKTLAAVGDALPRGSVTNETLADAWAGAQVMATSLKGATFDGHDIATDRATIEAVVQKLDAIAGQQKLTTAKPPAPDKQLRATLCGFETAILDLVAQKHAVPMHQLLGGSKRNSVSVSALTANADASTDELSEQADGADAYGAIRVKVGLNIDEDVARIASVAGRMAKAGEVNDIWVDVNQAWKDAETSIANLNKIRDALTEVNFKGRFICEQPTVETELAALAAVTEQTRAWNKGAAVKIVTMADEAVWTLADAKRMVELDAADYVNIKIQKAGGLLESMRIGQYLVNAAPNVRVYVGGVICTDVTAYANLQLCFALPRLDFATGCVPRRNYPINAAATPLNYSKGKSFSRPTVPGLGTALSTEDLKPYIRRDVTH